jgi:hypothetical protein
MIHPKVLLRLLRGWVRARLDGRRTLLPRDLWSVKGVATGGTDTQVFKDKIKEMWGKEPIEAYGCTEGGVFAVQNWLGGAMTLVPDMDFFEFIPLAESERQVTDPSYGPKTLLTDELEAGEVYEVVVTNFYGGAYTRYRTGDLLEVTALGDESADIHLPQFVFFAKARGVIDLGSFCRLTERTIWRAIESVGVPYVDWIARKTYSEDSPLLALHLEFANGHENLEEIRDSIHRSLCEMDQPYADLEDMLGIHPLRVSRLENGTFRRYQEFQQRQGADMAHMKPPHMSPSEEQIKILLN